MNHQFILITLLWASIHHNHGSNIVKEVEGGVQIVNTGPLELVVPEILSFTVQRIHNPQWCVGDFVICYEATTTIMRDEQQAYDNLGRNCPLGFCTLMIHTNGAYYMYVKRSNDALYARVPDESEEICPRKVVNKRQNFVVRELPNCPVIVNGASLPKDSESSNTSTTAIVGTIAICVIAVFLILIIIVVVYCVCIRSHEQPIPQAKSVNNIQRATHSPATSHRNASINVPE